MRSFSTLPPSWFEWLCYALLRSDDEYYDVRHLGEAGTRDEHVDVAARRNGEYVAFQCKRRERFSFSVAKHDIRGIAGLGDHRPARYVWVLSKAPSAGERAKIEAALRETGIETEFWTPSELEYRLARSPCRDEIDETLWPGRASVRPDYGPPPDLLGFRPEQIEQSEASFFEPPCSLLAADASELETLPLLRALDHFLSKDDGRNYLFVLGRSGSGKTELAKLLYARIAGGGLGRSNHAKLASLAEPGVADFVNQQPDKESTTLLLDGLDEDARALRSPEGRLDSLVFLTKRYQRVLFFSRTSFFSAISRIPRDTGLPAVGRGSLSAPSTILFAPPVLIQGLGPGPSRRFLAARRRERGMGPLSRMRDGWRTSRLLRRAPFLAGNPLLLEFVPMLLADWRSVQTEYDAFAIVCSEWIRKRERYADSSRRLMAFYEALAYYVVSTAGDRLRSSVDSAELARIEKRVGLEPASADGRVYALLDGDLRGSYRFQHASLLDYFYAMALVHGSPPIRGHQPSPEVLSAVVGYYSMRLRHDTMNSELTDRAFELLALGLIRRRGTRLDGHVLRDLNQCLPVLDAVRPPHQPLHFVAAYRFEDNGVDLVAKLSLSRHTGTRMLEVRRAHHAYDYADADFLPAPQARYLRHLSRQEAFGGVKDWRFPTLSEWYAYFERTDRVTFSRLFPGTGGAWLEDTDHAGNLYRTLEGRVAAPSSEFADAVVFLTSDDRVPPSAIPPPRGRPKESVLRALFDEIDEVRTLDRPSSAGLYATEDRYLKMRRQLDIQHPVTILENEADGPCKDATTPEEAVALFRDYLQSCRDAAAQWT